MKNMLFLARFWANSKKFKSIKIFKDYLKRRDRAALEALLRAASTEARDLPDSKLRMLKSSFANHDADSTEHKVYLVVQQELYFRECERSRI